MHITITGNLGSGKSTVCKLLKANHNFEIYSTGKVQRELASKMNMTTLELNQLMCSDPKYDHMIDDAVTQISRENKHKDIIFDSRLAWHFVEQSFKVFVSVSLEVAANRVMNDSNRGAVENYTSIEEAIQLLRERAITEKRRYKDIYNLDYLDFSNYNLVIDSTHATPEQIATIIHRESESWEKGNATKKYLVSPKRLLTKEQMQEITRDDKSLVTADKDYLDNVIKVTKENDQFTVLENLEEVKAAYRSGIPFLKIEVIS